MNCNNSDSKMIKHIVYIYYFVYKLFWKLIKVNSRKIERSRTVAWDELLRRKKSDTLVILGSGKSINEITREHWEEFASYDSIGFNFWPVHSFIPNFYFFETPRDKGRYNVFKELFLLTEQQYKSSLIAYKDLSFYGDITLRDRVLDVSYFIDFFSVPGSSLNYFKSSLSIIDFFYRHRMFQSVNFGKRASIIALLFLGIKMRYKRIIICGIDLMHSDYFYDQAFLKNPLVPHEIVSSLVEENNKVFSNNSVHKTNNKAYGELIVEDLIMNISKHKISEKTRLVVYNSSSLLSKFLPTYN